MPDITIAGASYQDVPAITVPKTGGGTARFDDTSDANATAADIAQNKTAYVNGVKLVGTASGGGGGGAIVVEEETDVGGGTILHITAVDLASDTVDAAHLLDGYTAHDHNGDPVTGTYTPPTFTTQTKSVTPAATAQTVTPDSGYDGLSQVSVGAIPSQYADVSSDTVDAAHLLSGYTAHDSNGNAVTGSYTPPTFSTQTKSVTPTGSAQTVTPDSGYDGLSQVSVGAIPSQYIVPSGNKEITANGTGIDVASYATVSVNVPAPVTKNVQAYRGYSTVQTTSYTATDVTLTVAKTGTYNVSWMGWRSYSSGTFGSQLYKNGTAVGTATTSFLNTYGHSVSLSNQSLNKDDVLVVYARVGNTSRYMGVGNLVIEEV